MGETNLIYKGVKNYFDLNYYFTEIPDDRTYTAFIKNIEKQFRGSDEYSYYIHCLKCAGFNYDFLMPNINDMIIDIELHHTPLTLYEIIEILIEYAFSKKELINTFTIIKTLIQEHFNHCVGLVMLCTTNHQLVHSDKLKITKDMIFGDYKSFLNDYDSVVSDALRSKLQDFNIRTNVDGVEMLDSSKRLSYNTNKKMIDISKLKV
jgi:hypothetical protein